MAASHELASALARLLVTGSGDGTIRLWDLLSGKEHDTLIVERDSVSENNPERPCITCTCLTMKSGAGIAALESCRYLLTFCILFGEEGEQRKPKLQKTGRILLPDTIQSHVTAMNYNKNEDVLWLSAGLGDHTSTQVLQASMQNVSSFEMITFSPMFGEYTFLQGGVTLDVEKQNKEDDRKVDMYAELRKKLPGTVESREARKKYRRDHVIMNM